MTYGFGIRAFVEGGASEQASKACPEWSRHSDWRTLSEACRLALIERALMPANDLGDGFPAAL